MQRPTFRRRKKKSGARKEKDRRKTPVPDRLHHVGVHRLRREPSTRGKEKKGRALKGGEGGGQEKEEFRPSPCDPSRSPHMKGGEREKREARRRGEKKSGGGRNFPSILGLSEMRGEAGSEEEEKKEPLKKDTRNPGNGPELCSWIVVTAQHPLSFFKDRL